MPARDQQDRGLDFNGQGTPVSYKQNTKYSGNTSGIKARENYGHKTFAGNASDSPRHGGPSATHDAHKKTIATAAQGGRIDGGARAECPANPDRIRY